MRRSGTALAVTAHVLLALPVVALLWVPLYAGPGPRLAGLPFFYWYQFAWVVLSVALMTLSHLLLRRARRAPGRLDRPIPAPARPDRAIPAPGRPDRAIRRLSGRQP
jgi:hypothetical protein